MPTTTAQYASIVYWNGIQNIPSSLSGIVSAAPPQTTVTLPLPKLTSGGKEGSITITNGVVTATKAPT